MGSQIQVYEWQTPQPITVPPPLRAFVGGHPLVAETLVRRGITTVEAARAFLDPRAATPASPFDFPDMERYASAIMYGCINIIKTKQAHSPGYPVYVPVF